MINKGNSKALRKGRASLLNHYYHIRFGTSNKKRIFKEFYACRKIIRQLWLSDYFGNTKTITFCIMPDHIHWLIKLNKGN